MKRVTLFIIMIIGLQIAVKSQIPDSAVTRTDTITTIVIADSASTAIQDSIVADTNQFATLFVYRPKNFVGSAIAYDLHLDNSVVCRVKNNTKFEIKIRKEGQVEVWAKTEKKESVLLNVKYGEKYFLKCSVEMGALVGRPGLTLIYPAQGELDYSQMK
jgi:hypothetical protein